MIGFFKSLFTSNEEKKKGMALADEKRYGEAAEALREALVKSPNDETVLLALSQALFELKDFASAISYLKTAVQNASSINAVPAIMLGYAYYKIDELGLAREAISNALKIDSKHPAAHYYMGLVELKSGNIDYATDNFEEVISEKPTFIQARLLAIGELFVIEREKRKNGASEKQAL